MFEYERKWENFTFDIAMDDILTMLKEIIAYDIMRLEVFQGQNDNFTKHWQYLHYGRFSIWFGLPVSYVRLGFLWYTCNILNIHWPYAYGIRYQMLIHLIVQGKTTQVHRIELILSSYNWFACKNWFAICNLGKRTIFLIFRSLTQNTSSLRQQKHLEGNLPPRSSQVHTIDVSTGKY